MFAHFSIHLFRIRRVIRAVSVVAIFVGLAAVPAARAGTIEYQFSPDASISFGSPNQPSALALSGTFDFNTDTGTASYIDIVLSNSNLSIDAISAGYGNTGAVDSDYALGYLSGDELLIAFSSSLASGGVDYLAVSSGSGATGSSIIGGELDTDPYALAVTGSADPVTAPEPASVIIFGSALAVLGAAVRRRRRVAI